MIDLISCPHIVYSLLADLSGLHRGVVCICWCSCSKRNKGI